MAASVQVVFDCANPDRLATFWAEALGYQKQPPPPGFDSWQAFLEANNVPRERWDAASAVIDPAGVGPRIFFQRVPEPKTVKNRVHLDVNASGGRQTPLEERQRSVDATVERLTAAGARVFQRQPPSELGEYWVVMQDPEGNEFCVQ